MRVWTRVTKRWLSVSEKLQKRLCRAIMTLHVVLLLNPQINVEIWLVCLFYRYNFRSSYQRCSVNKVLLEIFQNSQENTFARDSFLIKLQAWTATLFKNRFWHRCFSVNFAKFLRTLLDESFYPLLENV